MDKLHDKLIEQIDQKIVRINEEILDLNDYENRIKKLINCKNTEDEIMGTKSLGVSVASLTILSIITPSIPIKCLCAGMAILDLMILIKAKKRSLNNQKKLIEKRDLNKILEDIKERRIILSDKRWKLIDEKEKNLNKKQINNKI